MSRHLGRRATCLLLASAATMPRAWAQDAVPAAPTLPQVPPIPPGVPPVRPVVPPAPAAAPRPAVAIDKTKAYYVFFDQAIDVASMRTLRRQLAELVDAGVSEITLVMDSPGGLIEPMLITYSFIRALPARIDTHAQGFVQSAATVLFLAGQNRSSDRSARFLFHPSQSMVVGMMGEQQLRERLAGTTTIKDVVAEIYRDRTTIPPDEIDRFTREEVFYTAEQARAAGVVQSVEDLKIPGEGKARILFQD